MSERKAAMVEHYHLTYDLTYKFWKERNRAFLLLITTLAIAALISYDPGIFIDRVWSLPTLKAVEGASAPPPNTFLLTALCYMAQEEDCGPTSPALEHFRDRFPHDAFDGIISIIVLYLMLNITNLTSTIFRYYYYINRLEEEIRKELEIGRWSVAFSREGGWYKSFVTPLQLPIRYFYVMILAGMLVLYFLVRIASELHPAGSYLRIGGHGLIALLSLQALQSYAAIILGSNRPPEDPHR